MTWEKMFDPESERIREFVQKILIDYEGSHAIGIADVQTVHDGNVVVLILYPVEVVVHDVFPNLYISVNRHILLQCTHRGLDAYIPFHSFPLHIQLDVVYHRHHVDQSLLVDLDSLFVVLHLQ
jgi:hypothetical protein